MLSIAISRRQIYLFWCLAWFLLVVLMMQPIGYGIMRLAIVGTVVATWSGSLYLWWRRVALRMVTIAVTSVLVLFLLLPGDLAATVDGQHILAYVGRNSWIEADPGYHRTMVVKVPDPVNIWFGVPVDVLRWQQLDLTDSHSRVCLDRLDR